MRLFSFLFRRRDPVEELAEVRAQAEQAKRELEIIEETAASAARENVVNEEEAQIQELREVLSRDELPAKRAELESLQQRQSILSAVVAAAPPKSAQPQRPGFSFSFWKKKPPQRALVVRPEDDISSRFAAIGGPRRPLPVEARTAAPPPASIEERLSSGVELSTLNPLDEVAPPGVEEIISRPIDEPALEKAAEVAAATDVEPVEEGTAFFAEEAKVLVERAAVPEREEEALAGPAFEDARTGIESEVQIKAEGAPVEATLAPVGEVEPPAWKATAAAPPGTVLMEWLGWSCYRFTSTNGKVLVTNPWLTNPDSPVRLDDMSQLDIILLAAGEGDHVANSLELAQRTGARIVSPSVGEGSISMNGLAPGQVVSALGSGDRVTLEGITIRVVNAAGTMKRDSSSYAGAPVGFVITFENGWTVYFAGSTGAHQEQALLAEMYRPDVAIIPLNERHDPIDIAMQAKFLMNGNPYINTIFPHLHRANPTPGQTTVDEAQHEIDKLNLDMAIIAPMLGHRYSFTR